MAKKLIERKYESAFNSICELYRRGYVSKGIVESFDPAAREIVYRGTTFALDDSDGESAARTFQMEKDGASWFRAVREGTEIDSSLSDWLALVSDVAEDYHKHNSFLVFTQKVQSGDRGRIDEQKKQIEDFIRTFYPRLHFHVYREENSRSAEIDVFAINFMMDVNSGGVGETKKVLGKVYFKAINEKFYLLDHAEGAEIEEQINSIIETNRFENAEIQQNARKNDILIGDVLATLENVIQREEFGASVFFTGEKDSRQIELLQKNSSQINVQRLRVFGIYHIKWSNLVYRVDSNSAPLFNVQITSNGRMTVRCARCGDADDAVLMVDDRIEYERDGESKTVVLNYSEKDFGLTKELVREVSQKSNIGRHMIPLSCANADLRTGETTCERTVCACETFEFKGRRYCRDCSNPAIVCEDFRREPKFTETLQYASDLRAFADAKALVQCAVCKRFFSKPFDAGTEYCSLCSKIFSDTIGENENVYAGYRDLFPITQRMFVRKSRSVAVQDEEVIVFRLKVAGRDAFYLSDKLDLQKNGYLSGPKRIRIRREDEE